MVLPGRCMLAEKSHNSKNAAMNCLYTVSTVYTVCTAYFANKYNIKNNMNYVNIS